jgi:hypothetical protein
MRGPKQIKSAQALPWLVPGNGISGEKTKDSRVGDVVARIKLPRPKKKPRTAPDLGPSTMEPIMTGTWIMVALIANGSGIKPIGENSITNIIDTNIDMSVKFRSFELLFILHASSSGAT